MGQKVSAIGFRLSIRPAKYRASNWFTDESFGPNLQEDRMIRQFLGKQPSCNGAARFRIERMGEKIQVTICTPRPGLVIGKKRAELDQLSQKLRQTTGKEIFLEVEEIKQPDLNSQIVADAVARQLERRVSYRSAIKSAMRKVMEAGAAGVKIQVSGRLGGAEIANTQWYRLGKTPLHTLRADIDYAIGRAETTYGSIGVKVWITLTNETLGEA